MRFTTARRVEGAYSGRHIAKRRGGAGEFVDYREYSPGDDLRRLDWKAVARTGRTYLKLFQDETDLRCTLLLDCSGSMNQGRQSASDLTGSKLEWMQYFATALAHLIVLGRDAIGLATVHEGNRHLLPPAGSIKQRDLVFRAIEDLQASGTTQLDQALDNVLARSARRGVLLVMSDFLLDNLEATLAELRKFRARGWEIVTLHLVHPDERNLPSGNALRLVGWENDGSVSCQIAEIREAYGKRFQEYLDAVRTALFSVGCDYHQINTSSDYLEVLRSFMVVRSA